MQGGAAVSAPEANVSARKGDGGRKYIERAEGAREAQYQASRTLAIQRSLISSDPLEKQTLTTP